jgi:hypothetical protein
MSANVKSAEALVSAFDVTTQSLRTSGGASTADGGTFTAGTDKATPVEGVYESSPSTIVSGKYGVIGIDSTRNVKVTQATLLAGEDLTNNVMGTTSKPLAASTYAPSLYTELTQVTKANIKNATGNVFAIDITNINAAVRYLQLHNKATAPVATDVPLLSFIIPAGTATAPARLTLGNNFFTTAGVNFATGIGWAISTTYGTFTDSATATDHILNLLYV